LLNKLFVFLFYDLFNVSISHYSVWSVISAHNLTPLKRDNWVITSHVCTSHVRPLRTRRRSRP